MPTASQCLGEGEATWRPQQQWLPVENRLAIRRIGRFSALSKHCQPRTAKKALSAG
jgi:hypothetical protein